MANKFIGGQPQAPQAIPRSTRSDSTEGVGLLMPWALAVAAPRAISFTTMRALTPSSASGFSPVTQRQGMGRVLNSAQNLSISFCERTFPARTPVSPSISLTMARKVPEGLNSTRVVSETAPDGFQTRTGVPHRFTLWYSPGPSQSKRMEQTKLPSSSNIESTISESSRRSPDISMSSGSSMGTS